MRGQIVGALLVLSCLSAVFSMAVKVELPGAGDWSVVDQILQNGVDRKVFPGCVAAVVDAKGFLYLQHFGNLTYGIPPPFSNGKNPAVTLETLYDMASLTKVVATTTAMMTFYQRGEIDIDTKVSDPSLLGQAFANNGKQLITVRNLMLHNAGFPPDPNPNYWDPKFECPETKNYHPAENFSCQKKIYAGLMQQTLVNPVGAVYIYSDLSMITAKYIVGKLAMVHHYIQPHQLLAECAQNLSPSGPEIYQCYYEAYVRLFVLGKLSMTSSGFLPPRQHYGDAAPAWNDTSYRHEVIQGTVSDGNSYALGGIAGHAGLFSTIKDTAKLTSRLIRAGSVDSFLNSTTISYWIKAENLTQSSRALGWDTNNYQMNTYRGCGNLSELTYTHTGYTGTQICNDPVRKISAILFTNRVYPDTSGQAPQIQQVRQQFSNAVAHLVDQLYRQAIVPAKRVYVELL